MRRFSTEDQQRHLYRRENLISYVTFVFNAIEFENKTEDAMNVSARDFNDTREPKGTHVTRNSLPIQYSGYKRGQGMK
jgi:hypothetical protein